MALSGCFTVTGALVGSTVASKPHRSGDEQPASSSEVLGGGLIGAGVGLLLDVAVTSYLIKSAFDSSSSSNDDWSGYGAWGGND